MSVSATHPSYRSNINIWKLIRDCCESDVKKYIKDVDSKDSERNERYKDDARYANFTGLTKAGLVGLAFNKQAKITLPTELEYLLEDATGNNFPLERFIKEATGEVIQNGRYGFLIDYPASDENLTKSEIEAMDIRARFCKYQAENIINWGEDIINGKCTLTLVTLKEVKSVLQEDGFSWKDEKQFRVLRLVEGVYVQHLYNEKEELVEEYVPRDFNGDYWNYIPFFFVGAEDNDSKIDASPLRDLAELNIGHLRNSADYEESIHLVGQPTLVFSTIYDKKEFDKVNPNGITIGARRGLNLGENGNAFFLQAQPNSLAIEGMTKKEEQAVMLGAKILTPVVGNETVDGVRIRSGSQTSILANVLDNIEAAIEQALRAVVKFMIGEEIQKEDINVEISRQFFDAIANPQAVVAQLQLVNSGIIAVQDAREYLRKTGMLEPDRTDDDIDEDINNIGPLV